MIVPPIPENEAARLAALDRYDILDTPVEEEFDGITRVISMICDVPFAVINLIADGRQWFKSEIGFGVRETPLDSSFCAHAILQNDLFVIPDTTKDERFDCNPLVTGEPNLRFYAGALLKTEDGFPLGTLCVLDTEPRELTAQQIDALTVMSNQVMKLLELRRELHLKHELAQKLDAALRAREHVLAVVSHDLRTPLSTVLMTSQLLKQMANNDRDTRGAERLERAAQSMLRLVEDLLDFEAMDRGQLSLSLEPVDASWLVAQLNDSFALAADAEGIVLELDCGATRGINCDKDRILQALGNLVSNAIKHTPQGGKVLVQCRSREKHVEFTVRDTGPGFAPETGRLLFQPFWRGADNKARGAGLGLAITRSIIEAHGGSIAAHSAADEGATFVVQLPLAA